MGILKVELAGIHCAKSTVAIDEKADCREALSQVIAVAPDVKAATAARRACVVFMVALSECITKLLQVAVDVLFYTPQPDRQVSMDNCRIRVPAMPSIMICRILIQVGSALLHFVASMAWKVELWMWTACVGIAEKCSVPESLKWYS